MVDRSIILRRKVRPAGTTFAAKLSAPMRDRRSRLLHSERWAHWQREVLRSWSLSSGKWASRAAKSSRMPRYSRHMVGPVSLSSARGMPSVPQREVMVDRCWEHSLEDGEPATKSSM